MYVCPCVIHVICIIYMYVCMYVFIFFKLLTKTHKSGVPAMCKIIFLKHKFRDRNVFIKLCNGKENHVLNGVNKMTAQNCGKLSRLRNKTYLVSYFHTQKVRQQNPLGFPSLFQITFLPVGERCQIANVVFTKILRVLVYFMLLIIEYLKQSNL